jgi:hypothetical protein
MCYGQVRHYLKCTSIEDNETNLFLFHGNHFLVQYEQYALCILILSMQITFPQIFTHMIPLNLMAFNTQVH